MTENKKFIIIIQTTKQSNQSRDFKKMETLKSAISKYPVVVLSKTWCPYCSKAKSIIGTYKLSDKDIYIMELDARDDGDEIQSAAKQLTGQSTVPNVFIQGKSIGGCDNTTKLHNAGELKQLFADALSKRTL